LCNCVKNNDPLFQNYAKFAESLYNHDDNHSDEFSEEKINEADSLNVKYDELLDVFHKKDAFASASNFLSKNENENKINDVKPLKANFLKKKTEADFNDIKMSFKQSQSSPKKAELIEEIKSSLK